MNILFAPLEGITGSLFRCCYERFFGGIDAYYTPFVTTRDGGIMKKKEKRDILPENNPGLTLIPQIMTNRADEFVQAARHMEEMGYTEVNLNLGCPSGTVVPKGKGSGFLRHPEELAVFLEKAYDECPIEVSIKSRIGFSSPDEFPALLDIFNRFPVKQLILHLRTREEMYTGSVHDETYAYAYAHAKMPLCYNGDVRTAEDVARIKKEFPETQSVMIGRGFLSHPGFIGNKKIKGEFSDTERVYAFARALEADYSEVLYGEVPLLFKMKELWAFLKDSVPDGELFFKRVKKVKHLADYHAVLESKLS